MNVFSAHRVEKPCPRGWWGIPMCGPCNCDVSKGFNPDCNKTTGECRCKVWRWDFFKQHSPKLLWAFQSGLAVQVLQNVIKCPMTTSLQSISFPQDNYYRPKDGDTCFPCDCFHLGATSRSCDPETGQCPCKAGVIGRQCNRCDNPFSEVTSTGCEGM